MFMIQLFFEFLKFFYKCEIQIFLSKMVKRGESKDVEARCDTRA